MNNNKLRKASSNGSYNMAAYLRISVDDGNNLETLSITNQRDLIKGYLAERSEFTNANIIEYVDDGISGSHMEREAYKQLIADIEQGIIDCIIVKDLSRVGRNLIDVDDLLMNHLVTLNVRFIAIGNGYDSFSSPLSNLELAVINLANQHYNRDLALKSITARNTKSKRGEYLAHPPFGYKKSKKERNKLVIDEEAAGYVRLIFSLAVKGYKTVEIAKILNTQDIPSPSVYKLRNSNNSLCKNVIDPDYCFWTNTSVWSILKNQVYIGSVVANKCKVIGTGERRIIIRPKEEWIIVPNVHEPIISEEDFIKAQLVIQKKKYFDKPEMIFVSKVRCPSCGHSMTRYTKNNPRFKCGTVKVTDRYGCKTHTILQSDIEKVVISAVKAHADVLLDYEEMKLAQIQKSELTSKSLKSMIATEQKAIEVLESSITKIFTSLASGKISKDIFLKKKETINDTLECKRSEIEKWEEQLNNLIEGRSKSENAIADLKHFQALEKLNTEIVELLIDKILIHGEKDIEIVWRGAFGRCEIGLVV